MIRMTKAEAIREWRQEVLPTVRARYEQDGIPDYPARRESWNDFTDYLCRDHRITTPQYETWGRPPECDRRK